MTGCEMDDGSDVLAKVRRALGRAGSSMHVPPPPPALDEPIVRLVHTDIGLPQLFAKRAGEMKMGVTFVEPDEVAASVAWFLHDRKCKKIALPGSKLLDQLWIGDTLRREGFDVHRWDDPAMTLDALYDGFDCAVTDVQYAVAESGTLVIRPSAAHGRGLTLVPMYHVAIVEPRQFLPDMLDLFDRLATEPDRSNWILISGPSKTADIEMNVVTGVHGPNVVQVFVLQ